MMKTVVTPEGCFEIEMTAEEISQRQAEEAAFLADLPRQETLKAILTLESSITNRRIRESVLGLDGGWLSDIETQISTLRSQL